MYYTINIGCVATVRQLVNALSWMMIIYPGMASCTVALIDNWLLDEKIEILLIEEISKVIK